jgi:hypothetical protein
MLYLLLCLLLVPYARDIRGTYNAYTRYQTARDQNTYYILPPLL